MSHRNGFSATKVLTVVFFSILASFAVVSAEPRTDASITNDASSALHFDKGMDGAAILLDTDAGRVTLRGSVPTEKQKTRAGATVRNVAGVVEVRNLLEVPAPDAQARPRRSDAALRRDIERALKADRSLRYSRITVQSVDQGVVLLAGNAASSRDEARAVRSASVRPGVHRVESRVRVLNAIAVPPLTTPIDLSSPVTSANNDTEDEEIRRAVEDALLELDPSLNASVRVSVKDGVVWLTGFVPTWQGNNDRLHATRTIPGVRSIVNELQVAQ